jgi:hypothetical protein
VQSLEVAAIAHCKAEGLVVFYKPNAVSGSRRLSSINVNEPLTSLPEFMNIYQPATGLTARLGPPDKIEPARRHQTWTYRLPDGKSVAFDVFSNGNIGHITFYWPASKAEQFIQAEPASGRRLTAGLRLYCTQSPPRCESA